MTEPQNLAQTLAAYADHAGEVPNDLLDSIERGYRRRRRTRIGSVAVAAALVVVALVASLALNPFAGTHSTPANTTWTQEGPWRVPKPGAPLKSPTVAWPKAVVAVPAKTSEGSAIFTEGVIDADHVLVSIASPGLILDSYDVVHKTFARITTQPSLPAKQQIDRITLTPHWVVWSVVTTGTPTAVSQVYKALLTGGDPQYVGKASGLLLNWYASDTGIYWSPDKPGVMWLPLAGGTEAALAGFGNYLIMDGTSPWATELTKASMDAINAQNKGNDPNDGIVLPSVDDTVTQSLKNLVTGAQVAVATKPDDQWLTCTPQRCLGVDSDDGPMFIRRPDGSAQTPVPLSGGAFLDGTYPSAGNDILLQDPPASDSGGFGGYLWDPFSGTYAGINGKAYLPEIASTVVGGVLWPDYTEGTVSADYLLILARVK